jgi:hypothetical protein
MTFNAPFDYAQGAFDNKFTEPVTNRSPSGVEVKAGGGRLIQSTSSPSPFSHKEKGEKIFFKRLFYYDKVTVTIARGDYENSASYRRHGARRAFYPVQPGPAHDSGTF